MSLGLRTRYRLQHASPDLKHYKAPRPPYSDRIVFAMQLIGAAFIGYALVVIVLSLN